VRIIEGRGGAGRGVRKFLFREGKEYKGGKERGKLGDKSNSVQEPKNLGRGSRRWRGGPIHLLTPQVGIEGEADG